VSNSGKKDPATQGVLVVGSGYGALKAAEDLSHAGIPVIWVTRAQHFLDLPQGVEPFEQWPHDLNFQFRPLYLRVTRHPLVTPLTQARVESLAVNGHGYQAQVVQDPIYVDYDLCTGCSRCMELCPLNQGEHPPLRRSPAFCPSRALLLDKRPVSPCRLACPLGVNAQAYLALTAAGRYAEALAVVRRDNPLPGVCGSICSHPCEEACRRGELDEPLAIRDIKRFLFDYEAEVGRAHLPRPAAPPRNQRVAVVGSGPAGLCAAHFLNQQGFAVTVLEAQAQAGGMLRQGINAFRLPRAVLDAEITALAESGVEIITGARVESLDQLMAQGFDAVLLAVGTQRDLRLNLPGEDLDGVEHCLEFLSKVNLEGAGSVGQRTVVIGGGNSAMDAARIAVRLGARQVTVLAIETRDQLPAAPREVAEAAEEGVRFKLGFAPVELRGQGSVAEVIHRPAHWEFPSGGPPRIVFEGDQLESIEADTVIVAISQGTDLPGSGLGGEVELDRGGRLAVDQNLATSRAGVFAAGDAVTGPSTVIQAMAAGRRAAGRIFAHLTGEPSPWQELDQHSRGVGEHLPISEDRPRQPRQRMAQRQPKVRRRDFERVDLGLTVSQAQAEAERCLQCASCCECLECEAACEQVGAIDHNRPGRQLSVQSPAVVWAEGGQPPWQGAADGHKVFRVDPESYSADLMDVLMMGSAAAGLAMAPAAGLRAPAVPQEPPPRPHTGQQRIGFFLCTCNETMAPAGALRRILKLAGSVPGIAHSASVFSVCHPQGAEQIARAVEEKNLSQVILASCVCCPLNFQCISCNDQRTRARMHLFERLGLDRGCFEMINLRDHLHAGQFSEDEIVTRARAMLRAAFIRSRHTGPLRQGDTQINHRVLVLGGSQVGLSAARNLALQGLSVRLVHRAWPSGQAPPAEIAARPVEAGLESAITQVEAAEIGAIKGVLGDFRVRARVEGRWRTWKADVVCLTDENLISLSLYAGRTGLKKFYRYDFSFFNTPHPGVYRIMPVTLQRVDPWQAGAALAGEVATTAAKAYLLDHQLSPVVDPDRCRGCGRCVEICPFEAVALKENPDGSYTSQVFRHNCVGCGGCVGRCPVSALDVPYFSNQLLDQMVAGTMQSEV
jgi:NADPH-dependent glutamate synthase beta subunit-like oxidoreductase/Pyruvate/2-oxoacid:ferredoxin oxidoreductase delta subunit